MLINQWYKVLRTLMLAERLSISELIEKTGLSKHKIKKILEDLSIHLEGIIFIEQNTDFVKMEILNQNEFKTTMEGSLKKEVDFNFSSKRKAVIAYRLSHDEYIRIDDLAEELQVSSTTLKKDIKNLKKVLDDYHLSIEGISNKGLKIIGEEYLVRLFLINKVYDFIPEFFYGEANIDSLLRNFKKENSYHYLNSSLLKKTILVSASRIGEQKYIKEKIWYFKNLNINSLEIDDFLFHIEDCLQITLSEFEKTFIKYPLYLNNDRNMTLDSADEDLLLSIYMKLLKSVKEEYIVDINQDALFTSVKDHLAMMVNRALMYYEPADIFLNDLSNTYYLAHQMAKKSVDKLENILFRSINLVEINYLAVHFQLFLQSNYYKEKKKIALVSNQSQGLTKLVKQQIRTVVDQGTEIEEFTEEKALLKDFSDYLLVFSTIALAGQDENTRIIRVANILDNKSTSNDWMGVYESNYINTKDMEIRFIRASSKGSYERELKVIVADLEAESLIDNDFTSRLEALMDKSNFVKNRIAFPHLINKRNGKLLLSVRVLEDRLEGMSDGEDIQVIILLAVPEKLSIQEESDLISLYNFIFKLMEDKSLKEKLRSISSKKEFLNILKKGE